MGETGNFRSVGRILMVKSMLGHIALPCKMHFPVPASSPIDLTFPSLTRICGVPSHGIEDALAQEEARMALAEVLRTHNVVQVESIHDTVQLI